MKNAKKSFNSKHNHGKCSAKALARAKDFCEKSNLNFSPIRELIFKILWNSHKGTSAYDIVAILKKENPKTVATTVYRALDFLVENNFAHKVNSNNTFIGCNVSEERHAPVLFVCDKCGNCAELDEKPIAKILKKRAQSLNFETTKTTVEVHGVCPECRRNG